MISDLVQNRSHNSPKICFPPLSLVSKLQKCRVSIGQISDCIAIAAIDLTTSALRIAHSSSLELSISCPIYNYCNPELVFKDSTVQASYNLVRCLINLTDTVDLQPMIDGVVVG